MIGIPEGKARESRAEEIAEELSKIRDRHQDPLQIHSEDTKQDKRQKVYS